MNMRKRKWAIKRAMYYIAYNAKMQRWIDKLLTPTPEEAARMKAQTDKLWADIMDGFSEQIKTVQAGLDAPKKVWKVARVRDDVVVLEAATAREAQEAIDKAIKQKKAKLYLLDTAPFEYAQA